MRTRSLSLLLVAACAIASLRAHADRSPSLVRVQLQVPLSPPSEQAPANPLADPSVSPSSSFLYSLEEKFAKATAEGGGKAFSSFFADDAVTLANGEAPVIGSAAIAQHAVWSANDYQLTWTPQGARMSPGGDMGFTWGHYEGRSKDKNGNPIVTSGRYFTVWKKQPDGEWKVELDASNNEPANSGDCCRLP